MEKPYDITQYPLEDKPIPQQQSDPPTTMTLPPTPTLIPTPLPTNPLRQDLTGRGPVPVVPSESRDTGPQETHQYPLPEGFKQITITKGEFDVLSYKAGCYDPLVVQQNGILEVLADLKRTRPALWSRLVGADYLLDNTANVVRKMVNEAFKMQSEIDHLRSGKES